MTLEEQHRFLLTACQRLFPRWLQNRTSPEDIAQECLLSAWKSQLPVTRGLLTAIARQRTADNVRHYTKAKRFAQINLPEGVDVPFPEHEDVDWSPWIEQAVAILGADRWQRLLHPEQFKTYHGHRSAIHKAKKMILNHLRRTA